MVTVLGAVRNAGVTLMPPVRLLDMPRGRYCVEVAHGTANRRGVPPLMRWRIREAIMSVLGISPAQSDSYGAWDAYDRWLLCVSGEALAEVIRAAEAEDAAARAGEVAA